VNSITLYGGTYFSATGVGLISSIQRMFVPFSLSSEHVLPPHSQNEAISIATLKVIGLFQSTPS
jgi:hypothetical protein